MTAVHLGKDSVQCHSVQTQCVAFHATECRDREKRGSAVSFASFTAFLNGNAPGKTTHYSN